MSLFFGQPRTGVHQENNLKEFLSHLYMECMIRYKNETWSENQTETNLTNIGGDYPTSIPRYVEEAVLNEGFIDLENVDENEAKRIELYATISSVTLAPPELSLHYDSYDTTPNLNNFSADATTTSTNIIGSTVITPLNNLLTEPSSSVVYCPLRFDGYLCWPRTPAGTVLSQYCPDFVEGFNSNFLAHKTIPRYVEQAVLNEGSIDLENVDENEAKRIELYATISSVTLAPDLLLNYDSYDTNPNLNSNFSSDTIANTATSTNTNGSTIITPLNNLLTKSSSSDVYCPLRFDGYLCWPRTPAGTVLSQYCPDFVEGFNSKFLAHKTCLENGSWYHHPESGHEWSNYTNCIDYEDLEFRTFVNELYVKGYAISFIALILSLLIFLGFKSLRCTRIRIHVHLFASLAFTCITWIFWYKFVVEQPDMIKNNPYWCIGLHLVIHYFMLVNYFWMFCEGLHLHLVLVVVFVKDTIVMRWFKIFSWLSPLIFLTTYGVARFFNIEDNIHCWMDDSLLLWIFSVPVCISLMASFFFLINVLRVIVRKLHPQSTQPAPLAIRKAVRATIILVPLFGLQHFLLPYRPETGTPLERFYQILSVILVSLQGFVVSFLFCFANHDVTFAVRSLLNRLMPKIISPPPPSSHTGQMATTTPSRELGV